MGVLGLTPFLQKTCPEAIKHLPNRLRELAGKKIVIDGTLITQRMHFAPLPHQHRHVLGWYRLAKELEESGVSAICVFDGKERNLAKSRETTRRREARQLVAARGSLELKRLRRLQKLKCIWQRWRMLDSVDCSRISVLMKALDVPTHSIGFTKRGPFPALSSEPQPIVDVEREESMKSEAIDVTEPIDPQGISLENGAKLSPQDSLLPLYDRIQDQPFPGVTPTAMTLPQQEAVGMLPTEIPKAIRSLFLDYYNSTSQLSLLTPTVLGGPSLLTPQIAVDPDTQAEASMSKAQYELTLEEGQLWSKIFVSRDQPEPAIDMIVSRLTQKSSIMSASYLRRMAAPTSKTYDESREILQAMGIPCIESTGAFEAEALASAIVRRGWADYVASEDTDVLLYEAPLLRNITNKCEPLMMLSAAGVRAMLELNHDSFIDFALLLGTDFSERIKNVGPARALKFIKEYGSIECVIASEVKYPPRLPTKAYLSQVELARMIFRTLPPLPEQSLLAPRGRDDGEVSQLLQRFSLGRAVLQYEEWDHEAALSGNYFADNPRMY
ncbi:hypothetical protein AX15_002457 [Amanita polypyramis BW_CC]|nr:hypothetical protein AX15_002457 [Amanita polypyramis BW_CC]